MNTAKTIRYKLNRGLAKKKLHPDRLEEVISNSRLTRNQRARIAYGFMTLEMIMEFYHLKPEIDWLACLNAVANPKIKQNGKTVTEQINENK